MYFFSIAVRYHKLPLGELTIVQLPSFHYNVSATHIAMTSSFFPPPDGIVASVDIRFLYTDIQLSLPWHSDSLMTSVLP